MEGYVFMTDLDLEYETDNTDCDDECLNNEHLWVRTSTKTELSYSSYQDDNTWSP